MLIVYRDGGSAMEMGKLCNILLHVATLHKFSQFLC